MGVEAGTAFAASSIIQAGSGIASAYSSSQSGKQQARQYAIQQKELEMQKNILSDQYRTKRSQLEGTATARAGKAGVKVSGSVADSISQSLMQLGIEESYQKYNISMEQTKAQYNEKATKIAAKNALFSGLINTGATALSNYASYEYYRGSSKKES